MNQSPDFSGRLDFSQFHDLAHVPFTAYCRDSHGGPRRHVRLWIELIAYPALRRMTACRVRCHRAATGQFRQEDGSYLVQRVCEDCMTPLGD